MSIKKQINIIGGTGNQGIPMVKILSVLDTSTLKQPESFLVFYPIMRISIPPRWTYAMLALFNKEINIVK